MWQEHGKVCPIGTGIIAHDAKYCSQGQRAAALPSAILRTNPNVSLDIRLTACPGPLQGQALQQQGTRLHADPAAAASACHASCSAEQAQLQVYALPVHHPCLCRLQLLTSTFTLSGDRPESSLKALTERSMSPYLHSGHLVGKGQLMRVQGSCCPSHRPSSAQAQRGFPGGWAFRRLLHFLGGWGAHFAMRQQTCWPLVCRAGFHCLANHPLTVTRCLLAAPAVHALTDPSRRLSPTCS